jgi:hypothetical protein
MMEGIDIVATSVADPEPHGSALKMSFWGKDSEKGGGTRNEDNR